LERLGYDLSGAFASLDAFAVVRSEMSLFACATGLADAWAQWIWVLAGAIATFALTEFFVLFAFGDRGRHNDRQRFDLGRAFAGHNAETVFRSEMSFLASATRNADAWAQWIGVLARSIATFALTEFFVVSALLSLNGHSIFGFDAAVFRLNAHALVVFQETRFAKAADDAVASADRARVRVGARGWASGSASEENFVIFALGNFWWESDHLDGFGRFAFARLNADSLFVLQITFLAKASDDAVLGAHWSWVGVGACGVACRAAGVEHFVVQAFGFAAR